MTRRALLLALAFVPAAMATGLLTLLSGDSEPDFEPGLPLLNEDDTPLLNEDDTPLENEG